MDGFSLLHSAAGVGDLDAIDRQLSAGVNVNILNSDRLIPLHYAALMGRVDAIDKLLAAGANVHARDNLNSTPLHAAAWGGNVEAITRLLEAGADIDSRNKLGTPEDNARTMEAKRAFDPFRARQQAQVLQAATVDAAGSWSPGDLSGEHLVPKAQGDAQSHQVQQRIRRL